MESKQCRTSVIARLMGLEELPTQRSVQKPKRVLSENYLRRVASIGVRKKSSSRECHSQNMNSGDQKEFKDAFQLVETLKEDEYSDISVEKESLGENPSVDEKLGTSIEFQDSPKAINYMNDDFQQHLPEHLCHQQGLLPFSHASHLETVRSLCKFDRTHVTICKKLESKDGYGYLRSLQKFENGFIRGCHPEHNLYKLDNSQLLSRNETCFPHSRIVASKRKYQNSEDSVRYFSSPGSVEDVHPGDINISKFVRPGNGRTLVEEKGRKNLFYSVRPIGKRSTVTRQMMEEVSRRTRYRMTSIPRKVPSSGESGDTFAKKQQLLLPPPSNFSYAKSSKRSYADSDQFYGAREAKKRLFERWKMMKRSEEVGSDSRGSMLHNKPKITYEGNQSVLNFKSSCSCCNHSDLEDYSHSQETLMIKDDLNNDLDNDTVVSPSMVADAETNYVFMPFGKHNKELANGGDYSSHEMDTSVQQEIPIGFFEENPVLPPYVEPSSMVSLETAYQPISVLVLKPPFTDEISPRSSDDIRGMWSHFDLPKSDHSDTYSEGSGMTISSDDKTEERSKGCSKQKEDLLGSCSIEKSRNFSYLVDVLTEAGFHGRHLEVDFSVWHSPELSISMSLFESLEKKYGDKVSWKRSERKLLFDRINAGLMEILLPKWEKSVLRRFNYANEVMIEEDLWILLTRQEKEASGKDSDKLIEDEIRLDLRDDIDAIGREIEGFLIDELVAEFVSTDSF